MKYVKWFLCLLQIRSRKNKFIYCLIWSFLYICLDRHEKRRNDKISTKVFEKIRPCLYGQFTCHEGVIYFFTHPHLFSYRWDMKIWKIKDEQLPKYDQQSSWWPDYLDRLWIAVPCILARSIFISGDYGVSVWRRGIAYHEACFDCFGWWVYRICASSASLSLV